MNQKTGYRGKEGDKGIIRKNGHLIKAKTNKEYDSLFDEFVKNEAEEYCKHLGYSLKTIKKIGYKKFIDTHDWRSTDDVGRWKSDVINVIPCQHCNNEFTTFQIDMGLCSKCSPKYDMNKFMGFIGEATKGMGEIQKEERTLSCVSLFVYNDKFRSSFLKVK